MVRKWGFKKSLGILSPGQAGILARVWQGYPPEVISHNGIIRLVLQCYHPPQNGLGTQVVRNGNGRYHHRHVLCVLRPRRCNRPIYSGLEL